MTKSDERTPRVRKSRKTKEETLVAEPATDEIVEVVVPGASPADEVAQTDEPEVLELLGYGRGASVAVGRARFEPSRARVGDTVTVRFSLASKSRREQEVLVDLRVHFVKASGRARPKVFKLQRIALAAGGRVTLEKRISFAPMTTRRHHPGAHRLEAVVNGVAFPLGSIELR